jgi:hypothetical protein
MIPNKPEGSLQATLLNSENRMKIFILIPEIAWDVASTPGLGTNVTISG